MKSQGQDKRPPDTQRPGRLEVIRLALQVAQTVVVMLRCMGGC